MFGGRRDRRHSDHVASSHLIFGGAPYFFTASLAGERLLNALLFTGFEVEGVLLDFLDDVFLLNLPLKPTQCVFYRFAILNSNFRQ